jgi:penicillin-binding protein 2
MKLVTALTLLEGGDDLPRRFHCEGTHGKKPRCSHDHPDVDLVAALRVSCNRFFAQLASLHPDAHSRSFPAFALALGFRQPTGIDLPFSARGQYPIAPRPGDLAMVAMGQSMTATPLQVARVACLLANGGRLPVPRLAAEAGGVRVPFGGTDVAIDPAHLALVREGMREVLHAPGGTAYGALDHVAGLEGVEVLGKTGTATPGRLWDEGGDRTVGPWHLWFVGYASKPGNPRRLAFAMVLHGRTRGTGGDDAAPAVARFLGWWFGSGA